MLSDYFAKYIYNDLSAFKDAVLPVFNDSGEVIQFCKGIRVYLGDEYSQIDERNLAAAVNSFEGILQRNSYLTFAIVLALFLEYSNSAELISWCNQAINYTIAAHRQASAYDAGMPNEKVLADYIDQYRKARKQQRFWDDVLKAANRGQLGLLTAALPLVSSVASVMEPTVPVPEKEAFYTCGRRGEILLLREKLKAKDLRANCPVVVVLPADNRAAVAAFQKRLTTEWDYLPKDSDIIPQVYTMEVGGDWQLEFNSLSQQILLQIEDDFAKTAQYATTVADNQKQLKSLSSPPDVLPGSRRETFLFFRLEIDEDVHAKLPTAHFRKFVGLALNSVLEKALEYQVDNRHLILFIVPLRSDIGKDPEDPNAVKPTIDLLESVGVKLWSDKLKIPSFCPNYKNRFIPSQIQLGRVKVGAVSNDPLTALLFGLSGEEYKDDLKIEVKNAFLQWGEGAAMPTAQRLHNAAKKYRSSRKV